MRDFSNISKIIVKVGTSTLTHSNGSLNLKCIEELARVLTDIKNSGKQVILVTSGAIGVGASRLNLLDSPKEVREKQALSAIGQCELMAIYAESFRRYNQIVGQVLLTKDVVTNTSMLENAINTFNVLLDYQVIPIINENDTISTHEIEFGDNDTLSAYVANIVKADLLIILTDVDGLYDKNPQEEGAKLLSEVSEISPEIRENATGSGSNWGIGGMETKLLAAEIAATSQTKTLIIKGESPSLIYEAIGGKEIGTYFNLTGTKG